MRILRTLLIILLLTPTLTIAQSGRDRNNSKLIQFSGLVMTSDSLMTIPYVNIFSKNSRRGTSSDLNGYFNFVAEKGDTIMFTCIGFKDSYYVISDTLSSTKYSMVKLMTSDTVHLPEAVVRALPLRDMFDYVFVHAEIPDTDMDRARKNLERQQMKDAREEMNPDGRESGKSYLNQQAQRYYYAGQLPPNNLLNPMAWVQFFEAWKRGDFKMEKKPEQKNDD
ncbi:MAG: carboxypeptidase-like regulatory domain-containing protein [Flavobacteriales bacterium]|nr:carboxypeptidase-like regulatory domain-containing protein [Flavobacteriales bacterium]